MAQFNSKNQSSRVSRRWFTDIDINMTLHPQSGDLTLKYDINAVKRSIKNLLQTNLYERPFKPSLGSSIRNQLFELGTDRKVNRMAKKVQKVIEDFEPRVENVKVLLGDVSDRNELNVTIFYNIKNSAQTQEMDFTVNRAR